MPGFSQKIMIVEDDPDAMKVLAAMLASVGYEVVRAYGGEDALRRLKQQKVDLILTDLAMPRMSGVEVIAAVKKDPDTRTIPVVAVTAFMWDQIAQSAGQVGCDGFIAKPFRKDQIVREIEKHLTQSAERRATP
jgi:CheY-like chemotaxis protein